MDPDELDYFKGKPPLARDCYEHHLRPLLVRRSDHYVTQDKYDRPYDIRWGPEECRGLARRHPYVVVTARRHEILLEYPHYDGIGDIVPDLISGREDDMERVMQDLRAKLAQAQTRTRDRFGC